MGSGILDTPLLGVVLGQTVHGRPAAGPAIMVSFLLVAIACSFAALCYSELASMIPVAGSAYTYAYATLGELLAWIIGWDLILEYAVGDIAVASSWSGYAVKFLYSLFGWRFPLWAVTDYTSAQNLLAQGGSALTPYSNTAFPLVLGHPVAVNLPAFLVVGLLTWLLVRGISESAAVNTAVVILKITIVVFFIAFGAFYVTTSVNWHPFAPNGLPGIMSGAAIVFFAFIGFDVVSTAAEETRDPQRSVPIGILASLAICTLLYVLVSAVLNRHAEVHRLRRRFGGHRHRFGGHPQALGRGAGLRRSRGGDDLLAAGLPAGPTAHLHVHGPRRAPATPVLQDPSPLPDAPHHTPFSPAWWWGSPRSSRTSAGPPT